MGDAVPELFDQQTLWPGAARAEDSAPPLIGKVGSIVRRKEAASELNDQPLLKHLTHWQKLFRRDVKGCAFLRHIPTRKSLSR